MERVQIYQDRIIHISGVLKRQSIIYPKEIALIDVGIPAVGQIIVKLNGGTTHKLIMRPTDKQKVLDAIQEAITI